MNSNQFSKLLRKRRRKQIESEEGFKHGNPLVKFAAAKTVNRTDDGHALVAVFSLF